MWSTSEPATTSTTISEQNAVAATVFVVVILRPASFFNFLSLRHVILGKSTRINAIHRKSSVVLKLLAAGHIYIYKENVCLFSFPHTRARQCIRKLSSTRKFYYSETIYVTEMCSSSAFLRFKLKNYLFPPSIVFFVFVNGYNLTSLLFRGIVFTFEILSRFVD